MRKGRTNMVNNKNVRCRGGSAVRLRLASEICTIYAVRVCAGAYARATAPSVILLSPRTQGVGWREGYDARVGGVVREAAGARRTEFRSSSSGRVIARVRDVPLIHRELRRASASIRRHDARGTHPRTYTTSRTRPTSVHSALAQGLDASFRVRRTARGRTQVRGHTLAPALTANASLCG
jgi:hypothetical protein